MVSSLGTSPVASAWSCRYWTRLLAARSSSPSAFSRASAFALGARASSRESRPTCMPNSSGRPGRSPCQKGIFPGSPGAGLTITLSWVISSMRQEEAPRTKTSPSRDSNTISSSSSPTRRCVPSPPARKTPYRPRSGMVPALAMATRAAPSRARSVPAIRSQVRRGRSSANSSDG